MPIRLLNIFRASSFTAAVLFSASALALDNAEQPLHIVFGTDATYAPFESTDDNGEIVGFDIDIVKAMCIEMKAQCTFKHQDWEGIVDGLLNNKYDVIASSMSITPERKTVMLFTKTIWDAPNLFVAKKNSKLVSTPEGMKVKKIGVQRGTIQDDYVKKYYLHSKIKTFLTIEDAYDALKSKRIDAIFADSIVLSEGFLKRTENRNYAQLGPIVESKQDPLVLGEGVGFALRKEDSVLAEKLNRAYDRIYTNGTYKRIMNEYFDIDISRR